MKKCEVTKNRNSAIELLRIISMVMIIFHHFAIIVVLTMIILEYRYLDFGTILLLWGDR